MVKEQHLHRRALAVLCGNPNESRELACDRAAGEMRYEGIGDVVSLDILSTRLAKNSVQKCVCLGPPYREQGKALLDALGFALGMPHRLAAVQSPEAALRMDLYDLTAHGRVTEHDLIDFDDLPAYPPGLSR